MKGHGPGVLERLRNTSAERGQVSPYILTENLPIINVECNRYDIQFDETTCEIDLKKSLGLSVLDLTGSGKRRVAGFCKRVDLLNLRLL